VAVARHHEDPDVVPERLARFVASEWPGDYPERDWRRACCEWLEAHPGRRLPFAADVVEVFQHVAALIVADVAAKAARHQAERAQDGPWHD
jgi:hypothetical protein